MIAPFQSDRRKLTSAGSEGVAGRLKSGRWLWPIEPLIIKPDRRWCAQSVRSFSIAEESLRPIFGECMRDWKAKGGKSALRKAARKAFPPKTLSKCTWRRCTREGGRTDVKFVKRRLDTSISWRGTEECMRNRKSNRRHHHHQGSRRRRGRCQREPTNAQCRAVEDCFGEIMI